MGKTITSIAQQGMANEMKGTKTKGTANGEVKEYKLSPEELEKYRAIPAPKEEKVKHTNSKIW